MKTRLLAVVAALVAFACEGQPYDIGTSLPIQVRERTTPRAATFHADALPDVAAEDGLPVVTKLETISGIARLGQTGKVFLGRVTPNGYSIGIGIPALFEGYWTAPLGTPDPTANNELTYELTTDFGRNIPPGVYDVVLVAFDEHGNAGPRAAITICIVPDVPDNESTCNPTVPPPDTIISLDWDTNADLDLVVITPSGKVVNAKRPTTAVGEGGPITNPVLNDPRTGRMTRDSNAACHIDGARLESLVFEGEPEEGEYTIFVSFFNTCTQSNVRFHTRLFRSRLNDDGVTYSTDVQELGGGQLTAISANRGITNGTYITTITLP